MKIQYPLLIFVLGGSLCVPFLNSLLAVQQPTPVLDNYIASKIKDELSKLHDPGSGYRDGPHWVHFDNPAQNLIIETNITLKDSCATLKGNANGKIAFNYQVEISKIVFGRRIVIARHDFGGYADAVVRLDVSADLGPQLSNAKVTILEIRLEHLRMRSDAAKPFQGQIESWVNGQLRSRKPELEYKVAMAINTIRP